MRPIVFLIFIGFSFPAFAQVSLDDLDAAADKSSSSMEEYQKRLNDPDPDRALAVLRILIGQGDADQRRLAIRHGLQSTDRALQATTVRAILDSEPTLRVVFDPVDNEPTVHYSRTVTGAGGVIDATGNGSVTFKITGYDANEECWTHTRYDTCILRMRGDEVNMLFGSSWGAYRLNATGQLEGEQAIEQNLAKAFIDLSE
ncbi:hypothetical protein [uncultured Roseobacter sp.]|uniref:hypothetical protein n=1 Tax=uncultured Roseobacter sp. TaxID=114847 RepID=UPI002619C06E|nr:hypothetical protein [uncultured Roseobacter sp.]